MKPRTTNEKAVDRLAKRIKPLTEAQRRWISRNAVPATAYQFHRVDYKELAYEPDVWAWCSNCGHEFDDSHRQGKCPRCGAKFVSHQYNARRRVSRGRYYTTLHTTCGGWQVSRHILVVHEARRGGGEAVHDAYEVCQVWTSQQGKQVIYARPCCGLSRYYDQWLIDEPMSIKRRGTYGYRYDIDSHANRVCRVLPVLRRNGFKGRFHDVRPDELWRLLLTDNFAETLFKTGQYSLVALMADGGRINREAAMICVRHGYIVKDATIWRDYIDMAEKYGYDIHNPKYACPANLQEAHDEMAILSNAKKISAAEPRYSAAKGRFLGILIKGRGITIRPLQSVREFFTEGKSMHHCVYTGAYYERRDSLVLSARGRDGERIETIEFDLNRGRVVQSRGRHNHLTSHHDYIVTLCNSNAKKILAARQKV